LKWIFWERVTAQSINQPAIMQSPVSNNTNNTGSSIVEVNVPLFNGLAAMNRAYGEEVVRACAAHFGFDAEAAISQFIKPRQLEKAARIPKEKKAKAVKAPKPEKPAVSAIPLPWTGEVRPGFCTGLRLNHGLHTQCTMVPMAGGCYCKTCQKQADSNANGKPTYGCVEDRLAVGLSEYRDPKGKQSVPYATVMKKLNIGKEDAEAEAAKIGITIPPELFEERKLARGRPKKDASASDTDSSQDSQNSVKKARGRPKKQKKAVESENGDDLISALVAKANSATPAPAPTSHLKIDVNLADASPVPQQQPVADTAALEAKKAKAAEKRAAKKAKQEEEARQLKAKQEEEARLLKEKQEQEAQIKLEEEANAQQFDDPFADPSSAVSSPANNAPVKVTSVTRLGKQYLEQDGFLFDPNTKECVGYWNATTNKIEEVEDDSDDDE
jgi:hypothetical protein